MTNQTLHPDVVAEMGKHEPEDWFNVEWHKTEGVKFHKVLSGNALYTGMHRKGALGNGPYTSIVVTPTNSVKAEYPITGIDSLSIERSSKERYFTTLLMLSLCDAEAVKRDVPVTEIAHLFYGRTAEEMNEFYKTEPINEALELNWIHMSQFADFCKGNEERKIFMGRHVLNEKGLQQIVWVVGSLKPGQSFSEKQRLSTIVELDEVTDTQWYGNEQMAQWTYNDLAKGQDGFKSMKGRTRAGLVEHLRKTSK